MTACVVSVSLTPIRAPLTITATTTGGCCTPNAIAHISPPSTAGLASRWTVTVAYRWTQGTVSRGNTGMKPATVQPCPAGAEQRLNTSRGRR